MKKILALLALLAAAALPAHAQFIGNVALQTEQNTLATNLACTGAAQNFITGVTPGFANLGQTRHFLSVANIIGVQKFQAEIDGIDRQGNVYRISDVLEFAGLTTTRQGVLVGSGNFAQIQISVTCSPSGGAGTFSASYGGDFGSVTAASGGYLTSQIDHVNFFQVNGTIGQADNSFQTPFGNSAGTLYFQFTGGTSTGNTIGIGCNTIGVTAATQIFNATVASTTALQVFSIPAGACPLMSVQYGAGGGGGTTVTMEMVFHVPGLSNVNPGNATNNGVDPCGSPFAFKTSQVITAPATATTQIVPLGTVNAIYVCGYQGSMSAAGAFQWETGTGASCGTGTAALTGVETTLSGTPILDGDAGQTIMKTPLGAALCIVTSVAGAFNGKVTYVQQ